MREIRFRFWDAFNGEYVYSSNYSSLFEFFRLYNVALEAGNNPILEQFTGLYDKYNNTIYEGDIISNHPANKHLETDMWHQIILEKGCYKGKIIIHHAVGGGWWIDNIGKIDMNFYEIIGNIHENAELLE